jgi:hypothetical protein
MNYYAAQIIGLADMRALRGPFESIVKARAVAATLFKTGRCGNSIDKAEVGSWYALHGLNYDMAFVDGPYPSKRKAESERRKNWKNYNDECAGDIGRVGIVVDLVESAVVLESEA